MSVWSKGPTVSPNAATYRDRVIRLPSVVWLTTTCGMSDIPVDAYCSDLPEVSLRGHGLIVGPNHEGIGWYLQAQLDADLKLVHWQADSD
jgi:hypothetical protein